MNPQNPKVWVVFTGQTDLPWLRFLRPGFRHCFALLNDGQHWITLDPLSNYTDISVHHVPPQFDLPQWLRDRGHRVVESTLSRVQKPAPFMLFTCVEAVKRVLGLHKRFIVTPWQLYRHLENHPHRHPIGILRSDSEAELARTGSTKSPRRAWRHLWIPAVKALLRSAAGMTKNKGDLSWEA